MNNKYFSNFNIVSSFLRFIFFEEFVVFIIVFMHFLVDYFIHFHNLVQKIPWFASSLWTSWRNINFLLYWDFLFLIYNRWYNSFLLINTIIQMLNTFLNISCNGMLNFSNLFNEVFLFRNPYLDNLNFLRNMLLHFMNLFYNSCVYNRHLIVNSWTGITTEAAMIEEIVRLRISTMVFKDMKILTWGSFLLVKRWS